MATVAAVAVLSAGVSGGAIAETKAEARLRLDRVQADLQQKRALEQGIASDVTQIQAEHERLSRSLVETAHRIQVSEGQLTAIEGRLGELEAQEKLLRGSLSERHGSIARLLGAMQRMGRDPPPVMITRREDALMMVRSAMMLAAAFPQMRTQALALAAKLEDLGRVMADIRTQGERLRTETQSLNDARVQLSSLLELRRQSLAERQGALERVRREAAELARKSADLDVFIEQLGKVIERQMNETAPASPAPGAPGDAATTPPGAVAVLRPVLPPHGVAPGTPAPGATVEKSPQEVVMRPDALPGARKTGRIAPAIPFAQAKGHLPLPAQGKRILSFGDKGHSGRSSGMVIQTRAGAQVVSPMDGWIAYAGPYRNYGQILIINGGGGYYMLLTNLNQVDVQLGQFVLAGEPVGLMEGTPRGRKSTFATSSPVLYIELRKDGHAINPDPWWAREGTQKVQG